MFKLVGKIKKAKYSSDIKKEYKKILKLEEKRMSLCEEHWGSIPKEITITQRDILRNNFISLGYLVDNYNALENSEKDISKGFYFNIQGTKPRLFLTTYELSLEYMTDKNYDNKSKVTRIDIGECTNAIKKLIKIEDAFINLSNKKINQKMKNTITFLAKKKITRKINSFCDQFKGNEHLFKDYIYTGMKGSNKDECWDNYSLMLKKLNFIGLLSMNSVLLDHEEFNIGPKDIIYVYACNAEETLNLELEDFLASIKTKKYDFILTNRIDQK